MSLRLIIFFFLAFALVGCTKTTPAPNSSPQPSNSRSPRPTQTPLPSQSSQTRACFKDSDIDPSKNYTCQNGPNAGVKYNLVAADIVIGKKQLHQGEWPQGLTIPASCIAAGMGSFQGPAIDRAIRESQRCTDPNSVYEAWCGDYCDRSLYGMTQGSIPGTMQNPFCSIQNNPSDDYMGCFNQSFLFKLKDPPFNANTDNTFDLYIRADTKVSQVQCRNVEAEFRKISQQTGVPIPPNIQNAFQCYNELLVNLQCQP